MDIPAASICFEVWGSTWIRSEKFSISSEKSFRFSEKSSDFLKNVPIFQAKISDDHVLVVNSKNFHLSQKLPSTFLPNFSPFLQNNHFPTYFQ